MAKPPNVLLITSDQQHWNTLSCLGSEVATPHLDRLAARGTLFERAYCPNPTCTPTRASIITGLYPSQHGAYSLGTKLDERIPTIGDHFQRAGYRTGLVGKAHFQPLASTEEFPSLEAYPTLQDLEFWRRYEGPFYGFKDFELARNHTDEAHVGQHYALWLESKGATHWRDYFRPPTGHTPSQRHRWNIPEDLHYNTWIAERSIALLERYQEEDRPFLLWSSFFDPHPSYLVPEPWDRMYDPATVTLPERAPGEHDRNPPHFQKTQEVHPDFSAYDVPGGQTLHGMCSHVHEREELAKDIAIYYGMVSCMDKSIGRILDALEASGMAQDTLIVFTSDHGHVYGHHGLIAKGPFHYEDLVRVPFIVSWPGHVPEGRRSHALQSLVDLAPSFFSATGQAVPRGLAGVDQTPVWKGQNEQVRDHVLIENRHQPDTVQLRTYVDGRYKLTVYLNQTYGELFDLQADPGEVHNLWDDPQCKDLKAALLLRYAWAEMNREPLPMPRISGA